MTTVYDVNPNQLIEKVAEVLKKEKLVQSPEWAKYVKTGPAKERPPVNMDWWYYRSASVLRKIYISKPIGVSKLRKKYSSKKNRGHTPEITLRASGKIIRTILQQLEKAELIKFTEKGVHKGRHITPKGKAFLDKLSREIK